MTFENIVAEYKDQLYRLCKSYIYDEALVQDLYQEVLINIWKSQDSFRGASKVSTWVYRVCVNTALTFNRNEQRRKKRQQTTGSVLANIPADEGISNDQTDRLLKAIQQLREDDRTLIGLYLEELSYEEMAAVTGLSVNLVGVRINRIKKKLEKLLS